MDNKFVKVVLTVFVAVCLVGCCLIYLVPTDRDLTLKANADGSITCDLNGFVPQEYAYMVLDDVHTYDAIHFYYDDRYPVNGCSASSVRMLCDTLSQMLTSRGYHNFDIVDADGIKEVITDLPNASNVALMVVSGALPDTVQDGSGWSLVELWFAAGGTMYWMGGNPFSEYATRDGLVDAENGMFDDSWFNTGLSDEGAKDCSCIAEEFGFGYTSITNAIRKDAPDSKVIGLTDDKYSSLSEIPTPYGGRIFLFGGMPASLSFEQISAFSDMLVCGVTGDTKVIEKASGHKGYGDITVTTSPIVSGDLFFFRVGKPNTDFGAVLIL